MSEKPPMGKPESAQEPTTEKSERERRGEMLAKIVQEHPEVLDENCTPQMLAAFAQHLETASGDTFVTYEKVDAKVGFYGGRGHRAHKKLELWSDKPQLTPDAFVDKGASQSLMKSHMEGPRPEEGLGGLEVLTNDAEQALISLEREMDKIDEESSKSARDKAEAFLYTFRRREGK